MSKQEFQEILSDLEQVFIHEFDKMIADNYEQLLEKNDVVSLYRLNALEIEMRQNDPPHQSMLMLQAQTLAYLQEECQTHTGSLSDFLVGDYLSIAAQALSNALVLCPEQENVKKLQDFDAAHNLCITKAAERLLPEHRAFPARNFDQRIIKTHLGLK